jgi:hypothetical protein
MRDFDLASQLAMYPATAGGLLVVFMAAGGRIAHKHIGPLTAQALDGTTLPLISRLQQQ